MAKPAKPARTKTPSKKTIKNKTKVSPAKSAGPNTALDYVRLAATRMRKAKLAFAHGTTDPVAEAVFFVSETLHRHPDEFETFARQTMKKADAKRVLDLVEQRIETRKPAAYLLNKMYMRGVPFYVDERTIVPRSFIGEILDDHFADEAGLIGDPERVTSVLDLCTGSGCLAILAANVFPNAAIDAVDLSKDAIAVAKRNVTEHQLTERITLHSGDLFTPVRAKRYDLIISNPPYVDSEGVANLPRECLYEPAMAFDGGADGLSIVRRILSEASEHLNERGGLLCEIGRCRPAIEDAYPRTPFLWLDTEDSEGEVFWLDRDALI